MGDKSCLAVTFPSRRLPALGLVNPRLTARAHIPPESAIGFGLGVRIIHPDHGKLRHSCNTRHGPCRVQPLMSGTTTTLWVIGFTGMELPAERWGVWR